MNSGNYRHSSRPVKSTGLVFMVLLLNAHWALFADEVVINDPLDKSISCDYLVITPEAFRQSAVRLAEHRNSYPNDDVTSAKVLMLENVYQKFPAADTLSKCDNIRNALRWTYRNWVQPFRYVVFLGDDAGNFQGDSLHLNRGPMPTYIYNLEVLPPKYDKKIRNFVYNATYEYSDDWYFCQIDSSSNDAYGWMDTIALPVGWGRIPCETNTQCSLYIEKVIASELHPRFGKFRNTVVLSADDFYEGIMRDPLVHYQNAEAFAQCIQGKFISKVYLADFLKDSMGLHTNAKLEYFSRINSGAGWSVYFGHGNPDQLSDEKYLTGQDWTAFRNDTTPVLFMAFACSNAAFYNDYDKSMCKQYLFKPAGGALAYVASSTESFADENQDLAVNFANACDSLPYKSLGRVMTFAKSRVHGGNSVRYYVLGDPAINLSSRPLSIIADTSVASKITCRINNPEFHDGYYCYAFSTYDYVKFPDSLDHSYIADSAYLSAEGTFSTSITVQIPQTYPPATHSKFTLYAWNSAFEGNTGIVLNTGGNLAIDNHGGPVEMAGVGVRVKNQVLEIMLPPAKSRSQLDMRIYSALGKQVFSVFQPVSGPVARFNLRSLGIATGYYCVSIRTGGYALVKPLFIHE
jgi:hypothetical protein